MTPPAAKTFSEDEAMAGTAENTQPLVLVVDDMDELRQGFARHLRRSGCRVMEADSGERAMDLIATQMFDIAIVDLGLPGISGFDVVAELKRRRGNAVSVLVVSGSVDHSTKISAFDAGADDYVTKPVYLPELLRRISAFRRAQLAYQEARRAREHIEQLNLYASEAAALLAHDLSNGLSVALGNLDFLQETAEDDVDEERIEARSATIRALRKMAGLVRNFVELRQLEDAAMVPKRSRISIDELIYGVVGLHRHEVTPRQARIEVDCPDHLHAKVDPVLIERVVHNLVGNATRYVNKSGYIRVAASVEGEGRNSELIISVGNSGAGIPEEKRAALFEKYQTGGDRKSRHGMGLYFCRLACEAHGGSIRIDSTDDCDVVFVARIPAAVEVEHAESTSIFRQDPQNVVRIDAFAS